MTDPAQTKKPKSTPTREEYWAVMWLRAQMLAMPDTSFWWAILHPFQWAEQYAEFKTLERIANAIERGEHRHD